MSLLAESNESVVDLFMIEEIRAEENVLVLANYVFDKKYYHQVPEEEIEKYAIAYDTAINQNMFLSVEYDEMRGVIIGK